MSCEILSAITLRFIATRAMAIAQALTAHRCVSQSHLIMANSQSLLLGH